MTGKSFRGKDDCYVCGSELHWHCPALRIRLEMLQYPQLAKKSRLL